MRANNPYLIPPENLNATVWRYLTLGKFLSLIELSSLYFCSLDCLPDPHEGLLPPSITESRIEHALPYEVATMRSIESGATTRGQFAVNCWTMSEYESDLLWAKYTSFNPESLVIKSTVQNLCTIIDGHSRDMYISLIKYIDYDSEDLPDFSNDPFEKIILKRRRFLDEKELRMIVFDPKFATRSYGPITSSSPPNRSVEKALGSDDDEILDLPNGLYIHVDLNILIDEIRLQPDAPFWVFFTVRRILDQKGLAHIPLTGHRY